MQARKLCICDSEGMLQRVLGNLIVASCCSMITSKPYPTKQHQTCALCMSRSGLFEHGGEPSGLVDSHPVARWQ